MYMFGGDYYFPLFIEGMHRIVMMKKHIMDVLLRGHPKEEHHQHEATDNFYDLFFQLFLFRSDTILFPHPLYAALHALHTPYISVLAPAALNPCGTFITGACTFSRQNILWHARQLKCT